MLKEVVHSMIWRNYYLNRFFYKLIPLRERKIYAELVTEMCEWDTIDDISALKKFRRHANFDGKIKRPSPIWTNTHIYGIWYSLFNDIVQDNIQYSPAIEHGLIFYDEITEDILSTSRCAYATFGPFRKKIIRSYIKDPIFCVGPYIHYAKPFYNKIKFQEMKRKLGRTLLVFPIHSTEVSHVTYEEDEFIRKIKNIEKQYDSILVNAYWWNINDRVIDRLSAEGYQIVSAGFQDDVMFLSRLKTIIDLADCAMGNSVGTHIGYCLHENVPFILLDSKVPKEVTLDRKENKIANTRVSHMQKIREAFCIDRHFITEEQRRLMNYYWGDDCIKTPYMLKQICRITKDLHKMTFGNTFLNRIAAKKLLNIYEKENKELYEILNDSLH